MKLRSKFLLSMAVLTTALTAASMFVVQRNVDSHARHEISHSFDSSVASLRDFQAQREEQARHTAELLIQVPQLKAMMTTRDRATVQDASTSLWNSAGSDLLLLADPAGKLLAEHDRGSAVTLRDLPSWNDSYDGLQLQPINGRLYELVARPVESGSASETKYLGTLVLGYEIGPAMLKQLAGITNGQIAFRFQGHIIASTLGSEQKKELGNASVSAGSTVSELNLGREHFLLRTVRIGGQGDPEFLILKSYDQATLFLNQMNRVLLVVGTIVVLLGAVVVFFISHTFTQPLDELVEGVRALGKGDFSYPLKRDGRDEVAELTSSFNSMRLSLQESQQRVIASARLEAVGQLAGGVAHDFNNLITVIKGYAELLIMQIPPGSPLMKCADQIGKAGDRASSLTRQLLAFSRKQVLERQAVDLNLIVANLHKMLKVLVGERYEVIFSEKAKLARVLADPGQIEQVVLNLVVNARDAMPDGGKIEIRTGHVNVNPQQADQNGVAPGEYVRISVTDTGCGMDDETRKKIFQPFFTTKEVGKGTGLGLSIVYGVVKQSGGFVTLDSELGAGTTFYVLLPQLQSDNETLTPAIKKPECVNGTGTVLVVEDEDGVRNMVCDTLQSRGYRVLQAHNGEQALSVLREQSDTVDIILADVVLPRLGGLDLALRLHDSRYTAKILLMSGYTDRINEIEAASLPLVRKPFTPDTLVGAIQEQLSETSRTTQTDTCGSSKLHPAGMVDLSAT